MSIVYFQSEKELIYFCEVLFTSRRAIDVAWKHEEDLGHALHIEEEALHSSEILSYLVVVFIFYRMPLLVKDIIEKVYHYTNQTEVERIYELTMELTSIQMYADKVFGSGVTLKEYMQELFERQAQTGERFYFDSLATFCTHSFNENCVKAIALAIDDFKREEEYQEFMDSVRTFIRRRGIRSSELHILQADTFSFYKPSGKLYSIMELKYLMEKTPLYIIGLDENELNLSPVITLSPEKIYIYGNDPTEPKTVSLINLFQEKVEFISRRYFPFEQ